MTAPERRRPLPALAFIGALCVLTAVVWFRVIHRSNGATTPSPTNCPTSSTTRQTVPKVLPHPRTVSVLVLNSTNRNGIANRTKKTLVRRGFKVTDATNDTRAYGGHGTIGGIAEIRFGPSARAAARLVSFYFPHAVLDQTDSSSRLVTVSLGKKFQSVASAAAVRKAMRSTHSSFGTPKPTSSPTAGC
jgi:hypothetical protein